MVNAIQVGGYDPCTIMDFEIPKKYGLRQTIADTLGVGGVFRALLYNQGKLDIGTFEERRALMSFEGEMTEERKAWVREAYDQYKKTALRSFSGQSSVKLPAMCFLVAKQTYLTSRLKYYIMLTIGYPINRREVFE